MSNIVTRITRSRHRAFCLTCKELWSGEAAEIEAAKHARERVHEVHYSVLVTTVHKRRQGVVSP